MLSYKHTSVLLSALIAAACTYCYCAHRQASFESLTQEPSLWQLTFLIKENKQDKSAATAAATSTGTSELVC
jgi:hypothetical protein